MEDDQDHGDREPQPLISRAVHRGRGVSENPGNRFEANHHQPDPEWDHAQDPSPETVLLDDDTQNILAHNDSPDIGFDTSINPYRGCEHGCVYCYARPTHEYLGMSAGLDFETRILVKRRAATLLRAALAAPGWRPRLIAASGVTDCYQPIERDLRLTRACLEVLAEFRNPVAIITKNHLVTRDRDVLARLAADNAALVTITVTSLRPELARTLEPRASAPAARLAAIRTLAEAGIPVGINIGPVIPGLTDQEIPAILAACAAAGARHAGYTMLRLPHGVKELFETWLGDHYPLAKDKVLNRLRGMRGGDLYNAEYGSRMTGEGVFAQQIADLFTVARRRAGLAEHWPTLSTAAFRSPWGVQQTIFG